MTMTARFFVVYSTCIDSFKSALIPLNKQQIIDLKLVLEFKFQLTLLRNLQVREGVRDCEMKQ